MDTYVYIMFISFFHDYVLVVVGKSLAAQLLFYSELQCVNGLFSKRSFCDLKPRQLCGHIVTSK